MSLLLRAASGWQSFHFQSHLLSIARLCDHRSLHVRLSRGISSRYCCLRRSSSCTSSSLYPHSPVNLAFHLRSMPYNSSYFVLFPQNCEGGPQEWHYLLSPLSSLISYFGGSCQPCFPWSDPLSTWVDYCCQAFHRRHQELLFRRVFAPLGALVLMLSTSYRPWVRPRRVRLKLCYGVSWSPYWRESSTCADGRAMPYSSIALRGRYCRTLGFVSDSSCCA